MPIVDCPNGHRSTDPEWCDTCGAPIAAALLAAEPLAGTPAGAQPPVAPSAEAAPSSGGGAISCPHCSVPNLAEALFCEGCGYDFTTGQTPTHTTEVASGATSAPTAPGSAVEPAPPGAAWVVIVEVDAEWYRLKGVLADQPCPPPSSSTVRLTSRTALVGPHSSAARRRHEGCGRRSHSMATPGSRVGTPSSFSNPTSSPWSICRARTAPMWCPVVRCPTRRCSRSCPACQRCLPTATGCTSVPGPASPCVRPER